MLGITTSPVYPSFLSWSLLYQAHLRPCVSLTFDSDDTPKYASRDGRVHTVFGDPYLLYASGARSQNRRGLDLSLHCSRHTSSARISEQFLQQESRGVSGRCGCTLLTKRLQRSPDLVLDTPAINTAHWKCSILSCVECASSHGDVSAIQ